MTKQERELIERETRNALTNWKERVNTLAAIYGNEDVPRMAAIVCNLMTMQRLNGLALSSMDENEWDIDHMSETYSLIITSVMSDVWLLVGFDLERGDGERLAKDLLRLAHDKEKAEARLRAQLDRLQEDDE